MRVSRAERPCFMRSHPDPSRHAFAFHWTLAPPATSWALHHVMPVALVGPQGNLAWHALPFLCWVRVGWWIHSVSWPPPLNTRVEPRLPCSPPSTAALSWARGWVWCEPLKGHQAQESRASLAKAFINGSAFSAYSLASGWGACSLLSCRSEPLFASIQQPQHEGKVTGQCSTQTHAKALVLNLFFFFLVVVVIYHLCPCCQSFACLLGSVWWRGAERPTSSPLPTNSP